MTAESNENIIERFRRKLVRPVSFATSTFLPECLYHYTTATGFAGILTDKAIRATNFSFLNDPSELQYGRGIFDKVVAEGYKYLAQAHRIFIEDIIERLNVEVVSEVYVSCFTRLEDDLGQWRSYGSSVIERYALGFDSEVLQQIGNGGDTSRFARVLYKEEEQLERLRFVVARVTKFIQSEQPSADDLKTLATYTARHLARLLPLFKNPAYTREEEWRIILWQEAGASHPKFETARGVLRPFIELVLPIPLPLLDVYVMAPTRREVAMKATRLLLQSADLVDTQVHHSSIPFAD